MLISTTRCVRPRWRALFTVAALVMLCNASQARADEIRIGGSGSALGTMQLLAQAHAKNHPETKITVLPSMGSGGGVKAVLAGAIQLGLSSRPLTEAEVKAGANGIEYGRTPFVFATATTSSVGGLSTQDLVDIYAGKTEQWPDGTKVRLVLRPIGDSDSELIKNISSAMREAHSAAEQRKGMAFSITDQDTAETIEKIPGAIGPSTLGQILSERRQLRSLRLNGIAPDPKAIADGSYPLYKQLLLVTGPKTGPAAQEFVAFVGSAAGREILKQTGHWVK